MNKQTIVGWTSEQGKTHYKLYLKTYKQTKTASETTGFGVTEDDEKQGIKTMDEKLEDVADDEDGGLSAIAEDATTLLEDATTLLEDAMTLLEDARNVEDLNK
ncbi:hypothetical protein HK100_009779, partial [Physocladia obscura]